MYNCCWCKTVQIHMIYKPFALFDTASVSGRAAVAVNKHFVFGLFCLFHVSCFIHNVLLWTSHCTWQEHIRSIIRIKWCKPRPNKSTLFHVNKCTHLYIMLNIFCDFDVLINNVIIIYIFLFKWVHVFMSVKIKYCCRNA